MEITRLNIRLFTLNLSLIISLIAPTYSWAEDSDCLYEFNKAYANNEAGIEALATAQNQASTGSFDKAKAQYDRAILFLEQAVEQYQQLPQITYDCSPANTTIAKNNTRIAKENIALAKESMSGLDCLKETADIEALSNLSSDYYHNKNDTPSARTAAEDALELANTTRAKNICLGEYNDALNLQIVVAKKILAALDSEEKYLQCNKLIDSVLSKEREAKMTAFSDNKEKTQAAWQAVILASDTAINARLCDKGYISQIKRIKKQAQTKL